MKDHGWMFNFDHTGHEFKPNMNHPGGHQKAPLPGSYWGFSYPGNGNLSIKLKGSGIAHINVGNANEFGYIEVMLGHAYVAAIDYSDRRNIITRRFKDGDLLSFKENNNAIMMVNFIDFTCDVGGGYGYKPGGYKGGDEGMSGEDMSGNGMDDDSRCACIPDDIVSDLDIPSVGDSGEIIK